MTGKKIKILVDKYHDAGKYTIDFDATGLPTGLYTYILYSGQQSIEIKKMNCAR